MAMLPHAFAVPVKLFKVTLVQPVNCMPFPRVVPLALRLVKVTLSRPWKSNGVRSAAPSMVMFSITRPSLMVAPLFAPALMVKPMLLLAPASGSVMGLMVKFRNVMLSALVSTTRLVNGVMAEASRMVPAMDSPSMVKLLLTSMVSEMVWVLSDTKMLSPLEATSMASWMESP